LFDREGEERQKEKILDRIVKGAAAEGDIEDGLVIPRRDRRS
jgi:hypothetical protein